MASRRTPLITASAAVFALAGGYGLYLATAAPPPVGAGTRFSTELRKARYSALLKMESGIVLIFVYVPMISILKVVK